MRTLIVLCSLVIFVAAQNGYNYPEPTGSTLSGDFGAASSLNPNVAGVGASQQVSRGGLQFDAPSTGGSKRFFTVSAVDDDSDAADDDDDFDGAGQENFDVVLAQAPTPSLKSALRALEKYAANQRTAVYVLDKRLGADEISDAFRKSNIHPNKPEVHFVTYKTQQEAEYARNQIKAKYDALGGPSELQDEGSAPVQSFIGALGSRRRNGFNPRSSSGLFGAGSSTSRVAVPPLPNTYLPPRF